MIEFPMTTSYVNHWGHREASREIISNAYDAEVENNATIEIKYYRSAGRMSVRTTGMYISRRAFFLGESSKRSNQGGLIGKFGEGLTLACLVFARMYRKPKIVSDFTEYTPFIDDNENILKISENKVKRETHNEVVVSWECSEEEYESAVSQFLGKKTRVLFSAAAGDIIDCDPGKIFVRGVRIHSTMGMKYSYNLKHAELGRDRDAVSYWDIKDHCGSILKSAYLEGFIDFEVLMNNDSFDDVKYALTSIEYSYDNTKEKLMKDWTAKYGDAVPVDSYEKSRKSETFGIKSIVAPKAIVDSLNKFVNFDDEIKNRELMPDKVFQRDELTQTEKDNLDWAIDTVRTVTNIDELRIVDFVGQLILGTYCDGRICLSKSILTDRQKTLKVLVHEVCHRDGLDKTSDHNESQIDVLVRIIGRISGK